MPELRLVLFDCDGTLVDSAHHIVATMDAAFVEAGAPPPGQSRVRAIIGLSLPRATAELLGEPGERADAIADAYRRIYRETVGENAASEPLFPGTREMLDAVDGEGTLLGVATGKSRNGLKRILEGHGLAERFVVTQTADDAASKPAPEMIMNALAATGAEAHRTVLIGDSVYDMEMARAAGARALGVAWGYQPPARLTEAGAEAIAQQVADLPALIDRLAP